MAESGPAGLLGRWKRQSIAVRSADQRLRSVDLKEQLRNLGADGAMARRLDDEVDAAMNEVISLSSLTAPVAVDYLERLSRPVPALTPASGAQIVGRSYVAHLVVESDPAGFGAPDVPVLGTLPALRKGRPPQDLLSRVVKASRRQFEPIRAVTTPGWDGFVLCLTKRAHDAASGDDYLALAVVDGLARFGWVLRQVDIHYGLDPERR